MFYQGIKHRKSVFCCFLLHFLYIIKQMKKPKPCITMWQKTPNIREHSRNVENTRFYISFVFSNARRVLSQCNTRLRLLYLSDFRNGFLFIVWRLISAHGPSRFLFYANVINSYLFGISCISHCLRYFFIVLCRSWPSCPTDAGKWWRY